MSGDSRAYFIIHLPGLEYRITPWLRAKQGPPEPHRVLLAHTLQNIHINGRRLPLTPPPLTPTLPPLKPLFRYL